MKNPGSKPKSEIVVFVVSEKEYSPKLKEIVTLATSRCKRICLVSLNKPYETFSESMKMCGIDTSNFFFICSGNPSKEGGQVIYLSSPKALTELSITISKVIELGKIDGLIFDSLSTLLVYEQPSTVVKFTHSLISALRSYKASGFLVCLEGGTGSEIVKDLSMFADRIQGRK